MLLELIQIYEIGLEGEDMLKTEYLEHENKLWVI